jgi:hypothetical protein
MTALGEKRRFDRAIAPMELQAPKPIAQSNGYFDHVAIVIAMVVATC